MPPDAPLAVHVLKLAPQLFPPPPPLEIWTATCPVVWVRLKVPLTLPPAPPATELPLVPPLPPPAPDSTTVADTVPAGGVEVTNPLAVGVDLGALDPVQRKQALERFPAQIVVIAVQTRLIAPQSALHRAQKRRQFGAHRRVEHGSNPRLQVSRVPNRSRRRPDRRIRRLPGLIA